MAVLRTTLLPSLIQVARHNLDVGNEGIATFEIAHVYLPSDGELPDERVHVAGLAQAPYARVKGAVKALFAAGRAAGSFERGEHALLHPGQTATTTGGILGGLRPGVLEGSGARSSSTSPRSSRPPGGLMRTSSPTRR